MFWTLIQNLKGDGSAIFKSLLIICFLRLEWSSSYMGAVMNESTPS